MAQVIDGRIVLGIEDAPLVDALIAWTARVDARIAADKLKQQNAQSVSATDYAQPA